MKKILVPVDGSELSKKAAEQAVMLAKTFGSEITLLTIVEIKYDYIYADYGMMGSEHLAVNDTLIKLDTERSGRMLDTIVKSLDCADIKVETKVLTGNPHPEIVSFAEEGQFDLIIMGHRGLNPLQRMFIGSVTKRVIEDAPCSVYVIK